MPGRDHGRSQIVCKGFVRKLGPVLCLSVLGLLIYFEYYLLVVRNRKD